MTCLLFTAQHFPCGVQLKGEGGLPLLDLDDVRGGVSIADFAKFHGTGFIEHKEQRKLQIATQQNAKVELLEFTPCKLQLTSYKMSTGPRRGDEK
jgi:hypothetical protein